tara:strand:+ start:9201 stop:9404 length:204 start_codon:yes stop_codon:yes gene_type:complete
MVKVAIIRVKITKDGKTFLISKRENNRFWSEVTTAKDLGSKDLAVADLRSWLEKTGCMVFVQDQTLD